MQVRLLGPVELSADGSAIGLGGPRAQAVLATLAVRAGEVATADWLIDQLWGERPPRTARVSLQTHVSRLRRVAPPATEELLPRHPRGYLLDPNVAGIDAPRYVRLSEQGRIAAAGDDWPNALRLVREAANLWRGEPFTGINGVPALTAERQRLAEIHADNRLTELRALLETDGPADVIGPLRELAESRRWDERVWWLQVLALYRGGRQTEALRTAASARTLLIEEQGLDPSPALARLEEQILRHDPALVPSPDRAAPAPAASVARVRPSAPTIPLVGRDHELAELRNRWAQVVRVGRAELVLVEGEPGVGKSHLVAAFSDEVAAEGATALLGRCYDEPRLPLQPWADLLPDGIAEWPAAGTGANGVDGTAGHPMIDLWELAAHRVFAAITERFRSVLEAGPALLVAEDVHWAGVAAFRLLQHVLAECSARPLLVVATLRSGASGASVAAQGALGELTARLYPHSVRLAGLPAADLPAMLAGHRHRVGDEEAVALWRRTGGVPLLALEAVRGGHGVIAARLAQVSARATGLAELLAVAGDLYPLDVLHAASGLDEDGLGAALDELIAAGLVQPSKDAVIHYEFSHALYRDALGERMSALRRVALSRRLLAAADTQPDQVRPTTLARHALTLSGSGLAGDTARARAECVRAAEWSTANHEHHDAVRWLRDALELARRGRVESRQRGELELALGLASRRAGVPSAREAFLRAAALARDAADRGLLARVGVGWSRGFFSQVGCADADLVATLRESLTDPGALPPGTRARALAVLAAELTWAPDGDSRFELADAALAEARRAADRPAFAHVLAARHLTVAAADTLEVRRRDTTELLTLVDELDDVGLRFEALFHRTGPAIEDGEVGLIERLLAEAGQIADLLRQPTLQWNVDWSRASLLLWQGSLAAAEKLATESAELGLAAGHSREAMLFLNSQLLELRRLQGRLPELAPMLTAVPPNPFDAFTVARYLCAADQPGAAAEHLGRVRLDSGRLWLRRDALERPSLDNLAFLAAHLRRPDLAEAVRVRLEPLADTFGHGVVAHPVGHHWLGVLARALGRPEEARVHLGRAVDRHHALDLPLLEAESHLELARAHDQLDEPDRALKARGAALTLADAQGAAGLVAQVVADGG